VWGPSSLEGMPIECDHIVYAGPNLAELVEHVHALTAVEPVDGGSHEGRGTANALLGLGEGRYLELLGPDPHQDEPATPRLLGVDELTKPTVVSWAVRTPSITHLADSARADGYDPGPVQSMTRQSPTGEELRWRLTPPMGGLGGAVPFLIDWQDSPHPSEGLPQVELHRLVITHPDPVQVRAALMAVDALDLAEVRQGRDGEGTHLALTLNTPNGQVELG